MHFTTNESGTNLKWGGPFSRITLGPNVGKFESHSSLCSSLVSPLILSFVNYFNDKHSIFCVFIFIFSKFALEVNCFPHKVHPYCTQTMQKYNPKVSKILSMYRQRIYFGESEISDALVLPLSLVNLPVYEVNWLHNSTG